MQALGLGEETFGLGEQGGAGFGQERPPTVPVEELDLKLALQQGDGFTERGWMDADALGRAAEVELFGQDDEII